MASNRLDPEVEYLIDLIDSAFGIQLDRARITDELVLSELEGLVLESTHQNTPHHCLGSVVFWRFRKALIELVPQPKQDVRKWTSLEHVIPRQRRRRIWLELSKRLDLKLPQLDYPAWTYFLLSAPILVLPLAGVALGLSYWAFLLMLPGIALAMAVGFILRPIAIEFPSHSTLVGDAVRTIVGLNYAKLSAELGPAVEGEVRSALRHLLADLFAEEPLLMGGDDTNLVGLVECGFRYGAESSSRQTRGQGMPGRGQ